jgi:hypothetical protein
VRFTRPVSLASRAGAFYQLARNNFVLLSYLTTQTFDVKICQLDPYVYGRDFKYSSNELFEYSNILNSSFFRR